MANPLDQQQTQLYPDGQGIQNAYTFDPGVCVLPLAEDPPTDPNELRTWSPVVVLRLHAPYRIRRVAYDATKTNNPPVMPTPQDSGLFVFMGGTIGFNTGLNGSMFNFDWKVTSDYYYVENCVSRPEDGFVLGSPAWIWGTSEILAMQNSPYPTGSLTGAISKAGIEPLLGRSVASQINPSNGQYLYTVPSYYPGVFFSDNLINGGVPMSPLSPSQQT